MALSPSPEIHRQQRVPTPHKRRPPNIRVMDFIEHLKQRKTSFNQKQRCLYLAAWRGFGLETSPRPLHGDFAAAVAAGPAFWLRFGPKGRGSGTTPGGAGRSGGSPHGMLGVFGLLCFVCFPFSGWSRSGVLIGTFGFKWLPMFLGIPVDVALSQIMTTIKVDFLSASL